FIHAALDAFVRANPQTIPEKARAALLQFGADAFGPALDRPEVRAFWWPRFERIVDWFLEEEVRRRAGAASVLSEQNAEWRLGDLDFTLTARVDRIERRSDGALAIGDYKTGYVPKFGSVEYGYAPQLTLEAAMARAGAFPAIGNAAGHDLVLEYWKLTGGEKPGEIKPIADGDVALKLALAAERGLRRLVERFARRKTPYPSRPHPRFAPRFSAYDHLARVAEWSATGGDGE
ncbi:MAG: PD-(D/E)XK nuclease family protein, partial [Dongiaceae bacterium]